MSLTSPPFALRAWKYVDPRFRLPKLNRTAAPSNASAPAGSRPARSSCRSAAAAGIIVWLPLLALGWRFSLLILCRPVGVLLFRFLCRPSCRGGRHLVYGPSWAWLWWVLAWLLFFAAFVAYTRPFRLRSSTTASAGCWSSLRWRERAGGVIRRSNRAVNHSLGALLVSYWTLAVRAARAAI